MHFQLSISFFTTYPGKNWRTFMTTKPANLTAAAAVRFAGFLVMNVCILQFQFQRKSALGISETFAEINILNVPLSG